MASAAGEAPKGDHYRPSVGEHRADTGRTSGRSPLMAYWDTSCLVKLYVTEADSPVLKAYMTDGATVVTGDIARMELWAALRRKEAEGVLVEGGARAAMRAFDQDVGRQRNQGADEGRRSGRGVRERNRRVFWRRSADSSSHARRYPPRVRAPFRRIRVRDDRPATARSSLDVRLHGLSRRARNRARAFRLISAILSGATSPRWRSCKPT